MKSHATLLAIWLAGSCGPLGATAAARNDEPSGPQPAYRISLDAGHPWRPPFGLDRVGQSISVLIDAGARPQAARHWLAASWKGKELDRRAVSFSDKPPYTARLTFDGVHSADELVLLATAKTDDKPIELARQTVALADVDAEATARPDTVINPVDLGTILVPAGWLLLGPGQSATLEIAALSRTRDLPQARVKAWFNSVPGRVTTSSVSLRSLACARLALALPAIPAAEDRDTLSVVLEDGDGRTLWRKTIPVMRVAQPIGHPRFGATYERLRYDAPISIRDPATGAYSSMRYEQAWKPELRDVVVWLPNGGRFVFWRGSSFIPFWAGEHNTGACYEWAEIISQPAGAVDCVEPLMDKELRYSRVEIIESTTARVHVRWRYQSTDFNYKVWGDETVEDYYFYPDGFGTRVVNLKADPANDYELCELIILTPQGAYPFDVLPDALLDVIDRDGRSHQLRFPLPNAEPVRNPGLPGPRPAIYRLHLGKRDRLAAVLYTPQENEQAPAIFGPFFDGGLLVTPCYWGSHWPLARGNSTGRTIDDRIRFTPCHNSVMTWANRRPAPLESAQHAMLDTLGRSRTMIRRRWAWLIGMTDAPDPRLREWATSYATPPALDVRGGRLDFQGYLPERRAIRLVVDARDLEIQLKPAGPCVNPVFELAGAPRGEVRVSLDGQSLEASRYAWDGQTLWLDATIMTPAPLRVTFEARDGRETPRAR